MEYTTLNNNIDMPKLGFGVFQIPAEETKEAVLKAIKVGYRLIDTAASYQNEAEVGQAIKEAIDTGLVAREELFITTKIWVNAYPEQNAQVAIDACLEKMQLEYVDLLLLHQPYGDVYGAWRAMNKAVQDGKLHSIGVSNFNRGKLVEFANLVNIKPQVNQIEINPWYQRSDDITWHKKYQVQAEVWAPFAEGRLDLFKNETLQNIADNYNKSIGQVVVRWLLQRNLVVLTKSVHEERIRENFDVFDFELSPEDMNVIQTLDKGESAFFDHWNPEQVERLISWKV